MSQRGTEVGHAGAWDLIPWYVNGTLDAAEAGLVARHAATCPACRQEIDAQRRLQRAIAAMDVDSHRTDHAWRQMEGRLAERRARVLRPQVRGWGGGLAAAAALIAAAVVLAPGPQAPQWPGTFETLAVPPEDAAGEGATLRIQPSPGADPSAVRRLLDAHGLQPLEASSTSGLITVRLAPDAVAADLAATLMAAPEIAFVAGEF